MTAALHPHLAEIGHVLREQTQALGEEVLSRTSRPDRVVYLRHHPDAPHRELHAVVADAARILGASPDVYCRDRKLVDVGVVDIYLGRSSRRQQITGKALGIRELPVSEVQRQLSAVAKWRTFKPTKAGACVEVPTDPTVSLATSVMNLGHWEFVRPIAGVLDAPSMRPDGSIIQQAGWDEVTGYLYVPGADYPLIPEAPTRDDARRALERLCSIFAPQTAGRAGFPYSTAADAVVPIAALLTLLARPGIEGPVPAFLFDAPTPASGKTLLADLICLIATGQEMPKGTFPDASDELEKMLASYALAGARVVGFDNIDQRVAFRGAPLDKVLTGTLVQLRVLGRSEAPMLLWSAVVLGTGNNVQVLGDTIRRTIRCRLEPDVDRPENREGFAIRDIRRHVREHRAEFVAAGLEMLRAYQVAGCPRMADKTYGSFELWQTTVAGAIAWAGGPDVLGCRCDIDDGDDPELEAAAKLLRELHRLGPVSAGELIAAAYDSERDRQYEGRLEAASARSLREALDVLLLHKCKEGSPSPQAVGRALMRLQGRVFNGLKLSRRASSAGGQSGHWLVTRPSGGFGVSEADGVSATCFADESGRAVIWYGSEKTPPTPSPPDRGATLSSLQGQGGVS
jgi:hypothetical protein